MRRYANFMKVYTFSNIFGSSYVQNIYVERNVQFAILVWFGYVKEVMLSLLTGCTCILILMSFVHFHVIIDFKK